MKDIVKISNKTDSLNYKDVISSLSVHIIVAVIGFIASRSVVLGNLLPFGLSFLAGSTLSLTPSAAIGIFIGYFFPAVGNSGFRYIASLFAIIAIKFILSSYKRIIKNPYFAAIISFLANIITALVSLGMSDMSIANIFTEALLCAAGAYFFSNVFKTLNGSTAILSSDELTSVLICISIIISGLTDISLSGVSLGRILAALLVLTSAKYGGIVSGAVSGISVALTITLSGGSANIGIAFAFAGLMAGVFSHLGKYAEIGVMLVFTFIGAIPSSESQQITAVIVEVILGSILFLSLPRRAGIVLSKIFTSKPQVSIPHNIKKSLTMRLELASNALRDVSDTVDQVSNELAKINSPDFGTVINFVEQDACAGCKLRIHCWETKRQDTINAVLEMTKAIKKGDFSPENSAPTEFKGRCLKPTSVANVTYKRFSDYASRIAAENRIDEVRSVVSDQFNGISEMLYDLSLDFKNDEKFDNAAAENSAVALKNLDIIVDEASGRIDKYGRMTLEFKLKKTPELVINKLQVMKTVSVVCERDFDIPQISQVGNDIFITLNEHAAIKIDFGAFQISAGNSNMCGDAYKCFYDGKGHYVMVLSDGMGTGGRAAVDGAMASGLMSRLIKAGFGYDCSLRILNSSMLFKSTDESLATVDIASIDLYTGKTELYKAGAAPTIVRRSGKTGKAESTSLPAGILREIGFDKAVVKCKPKDIVVMMSDGVTSMGTDWIRAEIESFCDGNAQSLAERLCECAKRRRTDDHEDDITVLVAVLE